MKYKITKIAFVSGLSCVLSSGAFGQVKQGTVINGGGFSYQETIDPKVLEPEIASFTEVARRLEALNQSEISTACEKLDLLWSQIEATSQTPDSLFAPTGSFKDVVTFGNGSALRYGKIFSGWTLEEGAGKNAAPDEHLGNEIRPYRKGHIRDTVRLTHRYGVNVKLVIFGQLFQRGTGLVQRGRQQAAFLGPHHHVFQHRAEAFGGGVDLRLSFCG